MKRVKVFIFAFITSYVLVTGIGLLLQLRPWEADTSKWVLQHPQIYIFDFIVLQIPAIGVLPSLWFGSAWPELPLLILSSMICVSTWKNWYLPERVDRLQKLGRYSYYLAVLAVALRLMPGVPFFNNETSLENLLDIRDPRVTMAWISFQTTLILTLVFVHLALRISSQTKAPVTK